METGRSGRLKKVLSGVAFCRCMQFRNNHQAYKEPSQYKTYQQAAKAQNAKANGYTEYKKDNKKRHSQNGSVQMEQIFRTCTCSCCAGRTTSSRCACRRIGISGILHSLELHHVAHLLESLRSLYSYALVMSSVKMRKNCRKQATVLYKFYNYSYYILLYDRIGHTYVHILGDSGWNLHPGLHFLKKFVMV